MEDILSNSCPPPSIMPTNKLNEKNYYLNFDNQKYVLIISLYDEFNNRDKLFNFKLVKLQIINENNIYYENNMYSSQLLQLFDLNYQNIIDPVSAIFEKIAKFHLNNNVFIKKNINSENKLDLVYILKTIDNREISLIIELNRKDDEQKIETKLLGEIRYLKNYIKNMENNYKQSINSLTQKINYLTNIINEKINKNEQKQIISEEEQQLLFKTDITKINNKMIVNSNIDGGRGVNDLFEVYHLYNDKKTVYLAYKRKQRDSDISFIDIIKITSIKDFVRITILKGHQKRINFIKYYINPYNKKEYLISGDREEIVRVWGIKDENNYVSLIYIKTNYGRLILQQSIYNCILYFTEYRNYIYTTTCTNNNSRLYDLEDGALLREISLTSEHYTFYLIRYRDYIVDVCKNYVIIYQLFNEEVYAKIECSGTKGDNRSACIIYNKNDTDYLNISNSNGNIIIYDLKKKEIFSIVNLKSDLYHIIPWDINTLLVTQYNKEYLGIVSFDTKTNIEKTGLRTCFFCSNIAASKLMLLFCI